LLILTFLMAAISAPVETTACPITPPAVNDQAWRNACDAAIAAATEPRLKAELLFRRAYGHNETQDYFEAERALQEATRLDPDNVRAWHELSYTENSLGNYPPAEQAADRAIALQPDFAAHYQERAMARHFRGNFEGAYADRDRVARLAPEDPGHAIGRALEGLWLGRFDAAAADLDAAAAHPLQDNDRQALEHARALLRLWRTRSGATDPGAACAWPRDNADLLRPGFIGDCSAAFLAETRPAKRAEFLTYRSLAWLSAAQDRQASIADRAVAVALDPENPDMHANFAFASLDSHHSWAAAREFDRALAIRESWAALAGRASAKYNLHDPQGAFADARRSFELHPNELALTVLGDLLHDRGDDASAKLYWMGAYHLGDRDDGLIARLRAIGVQHPENEPAGETRPGSRLRPEPGSEARQPIQRPS
jgi:tetratricopeptide (TPR) repeat protein